MKSTKFCVIPEWSAAIQADMDVSGSILATWMPAIHAGMTEICVFNVLWTSWSLRGENVFRQSGVPVMNDAQ